ncbi:MAG: peptide ABC transporter substrate-binding protein [bacterium]|nr:peptide ABC transporter substrate-binding protein [bacterium]
MSFHPSGFRGRIGASRTHASFAKLARLPAVLRGHERATFFGGIAILLVGIGLATIGWYRSATTVIPAVGGTYVEGLLGTPRFVNPLFAPANDADQDLVRLVYAGLLRFDATGVLVPDLAEQYAIADDGKSVTVTLRPNARWHDGAEVTADDVLFTVRLLQHADVASPLRGSFRGVTAERVDDRTVRFVMERPLAVFLSALTIGIMPEHRWLDVPPAQLPLAELNLRPIGAGPYRFAGLTKDAQGGIRTYTLERNAEYHETPPHIARVTFRFYSTEQALRDAFAAREVDGVGTLLPAHLLANTRGDAELRTVMLPQTTAAFLNAKRNPALADLRTRKALSFAVDRQALITDALGGSGVAIGGPIIPGFTGKADPSTPDAFDADAAAALLDAAGWKRTDADAYVGLRTKQLLLELEIAKKKAGKKTSALAATDEERTQVDAHVQAELGQHQPYYRLASGQPLTVELVAPDATELIRMAEFLRDAWQRIGITVQLTIAPLDRVRGELIPNREYDALLFSQILGPDPDPFPFWHSSQVRHPGLNLSYFSSKKMDTLLEDARAQLNHERRGLQYAEFQELLREERPSVFLITPTLAYPMTNGVHGVTIGNLTQPADRFATITEWYTETERTWNKDPGTVIEQARMPPTQ